MVTPPSNVRPGNKVLLSISKSKSTKNHADRIEQEPRDGTLPLKKKDQCIQVDMSKEESDGEIRTRLPQLLHPASCDGSNQQVEYRCQVSSNEPPKYHVSDSNTVDMKPRTTYERHHNPEVRTYILFEQI